MSKKVYRREFWCESCGMKEPIKGPELIEHLKTKHGITVISGKKKAVQFLDFEGGYQNNYEWTLPGGIKVTEVSSGETVP